MGKIKYTNEELTDAVKNSKSYASVCEILGKAGSGTFQSKVKREIKSLGLDITHFTGKLWSKGSTVLQDDRLSRKGVDIFSENSSYAKSYIRSLVLKNKLIPYKCDLCDNNGTWKDKGLSLQMDHINGNNVDNRLTNLRFLCPNCHSQTPTYGSKNQKFTGVKKVTDEQIINACKNHDSVHQALKSLNIENGRNYARAYKLLDKNKS